MQFAICVFTVFSVLSVSSAQAAVPQWIVIGSVGKWSCAKIGSEEKAALRVGSPLVPGVDELVRDGSDKKSGSVTLLAGSAHLTFACDDPHTLPKGSNMGCVEPIQVPSEAPPDTAGTDGALTTLFTAVARLFQREPTAFYSAVSRDYGGFDDAVVELRGHSVDIKPALAELSKGEYVLRFQPLHGGAVDASSAKVQVSVVWNPETKPDVAGPDLVPGLYFVTVTAGDGNSAGEAWLLVAPSSQFAAKAAQFDKVKALTATWKDDAPAASIRAVNRAALEQLAH